MELTKERATQLLNKISRYEKKKNDNIFDDFYREDLWDFRQLINDAISPKEKFEDVIKSLTEKEKKALNESVSALYFFDNSDYQSFLWGVIKALLEDQFDFDEIDGDKFVRELFNVLNPESE